jgi:hypothetical protein
MKINTRANAGRQGSSLLAALFICMVLCLLVASYLQLLRQQTSYSTRSQTWNSAMAIVEAGIEEGLEFINNGCPNPTANGWTADGLSYTRTQTLADGNSYVVTAYLTNSAAPVVIAQANVKLPALVRNTSPYFFAAAGVTTSPDITVVKRAVRVVCSKPGGYNAALIVQHGIDLKGNGVYTDSYNSQDPAKSVNRQYSAAKYSGDKGDVSSNGGISDSVNVQNGNVYGKVHTGPGCPVAIGPNGGIGPHGSQTGSVTDAVAKGYIVQDANFTFPDVTFPGGSLLPPTSGCAPGTTNYYNNLLFGNSSYTSSSLSGKTFVAGSNATLVLPNGLTGAEYITLNTNASLMIYAGGTSFTASGNQIINYNGVPASFIVLCASSVKTFSLSGNGTFTGVLIAPAADVTLKGSGNNQQDFCGTLVANSITLNGHFSFHYDESLSNLTSNGRFLIASWDEITPR